MLRRCAVASCLWERPGAKSNRRAKTTQDCSIWPPIWPRLPKMASNMASKSPSSSSSSFSAPLLLLPASPLLLACPFSHSSPPLLPLLRQPPTSPQALSRPLLIRFLSRLLHLPLSPRHHSLFHRNAHQVSALARIKSNNECERPARFDSRAFGRSRSGTLTTDRDKTDRQKPWHGALARRSGHAERVHADSTTNSKPANPGRARGSTHRSSTGRAPRNHQSTSYLTAVGVRLRHSL